MSSLRSLSHLTGVAAATAIALMVGLTGCASGASTSSPTGSARAEVNPSGDIPDNQAYVPFTPPAGQYTVSVPEGWAQSSDGAATTFSDKLNSARFEQRSTPSAPSTATVTADVVPALRSAHPGFALTDVTPFARAGGSGVLVRYEADAPANAVTASGHRQAVEDYLFWKNGTQVDVTLTSPKGADNVDPWKKITDSFTWR